MREISEIWEETDGKGVNLSPKQVMLVQALENGRLWKYEVLKDHIWGDFWPERHEEGLKVHIHNLRKKGYDIQSVKEIGYRMVKNG